MKKLHRSTDKRIFAGVCSGIAEYFSIDANIVRLVTVLLVLVSGIVPIVVLYFVAALLLPEKVVGRNKR